MRIGLSVYGTIFSMGIHPAAGRAVITPLELMERAVAEKLAGVEIPFSLLHNKEIAPLVDYAREHNLFITIDTGSYDPAHLRDVIALGQQLGALTVRTVVGGAKLGGDRRPLAGRWQPFLADALEKLREATRYAEDAHINLAVENHQDLASEELLWLCESIDSPYFGITFDTGNPLATVEEPIDFTRRIAHFVKNIHLKDYWIYHSEEGYYLVRSPLGQGVIDFPTLLAILNEANPTLTAVVELGALEARHVRVLADDFWPDYPPRTAAQLAHVLRFVQDHARSGGDRATPFEQGAPAAEIAAYEEAQLAESLTYVHTLGFTQAK